MEILTAIHDDFAPLIPLHGRIDDPIVDRRLPFLPPAQLENVAEQGKHRERSVVFSAEGYDAARNLAAPARVERERQKKDKQIQQAALPISNVIVLYDQRGLGRFTTADVQAQLTQRKVAFKKTDKVGTLMEMRKTYDAAANILDPAHAAHAAGAAFAVGGGGGAAAAAKAPAAVAAVALAAAEAMRLPASVAAAPAPHAPIVAAVEAAVAPAAVAPQRKCALCNQFGHRADNKTFHPAQQ